MSEINDLTSYIHYIAVDKGWWEEPRTFGDIIALCHSELSEALEEYRNGHSVNTIRYDTLGKPEGIPIELADVIIRILDTAGYYNIDMQEALDIKVAYNISRPFRHGGKAL